METFGSTSWLNMALHLCVLRLADQLSIVSLVAGAGADSTIQNVSTVDMKVNGKTLVTIPIAKGKTGAFISVSLWPQLATFRSRSRQYFVVDNQFNTVDYCNGKKDKLLDLMEGRLVANSF